MSEGRKKITKLTPEEQAQLEPWADKWIEIGSRTGPADRSLWEEGARECYGYAEIEWPDRVVWVQSPFVGAIASSMAEALYSRGHENATFAALMRGARTRTKETALVEAIAEAAQAALNADAKACSKAEAETAFRDMSWHYWLGGQMWVGYGWGWGNAYTSFFRDVCKLELDGDLWDRSRAYDKTALSASYWWPNRRFTMACERPSEIHLELVDPTRPRGWGSHRLHNESGPAIAWPDGWGVWAWHGIRVPRHVIERPQDLTVKQAFDEENVEVRRVMLTLIGPERIEREGELTLLHEEKEDAVEVGRGRDGLPVPMGLRGGRLYELAPSDSEMPRMRWVSLVNSTPEPSGESKRYFLRVPPTVNTVREAVAWTFGMEAGEYQPEMES